MDNTRLLIIKKIYKKEKKERKISLIMRQSGVKIKKK